MTSKLGKSAMTQSFETSPSTKKMGMSYDKISFGVPRECFSNVVGPNKFNYLPFKASLPGPGKYGTGGNPFRELGSDQVKVHRYSMAPRSEFCHVRDEKHRKLFLDFFLIDLISIVYKLNETPGPGAYESLSPRVPTGIIKKPIHP